MTHEAERIPTLLCFDDLWCRLVVWKVARLSKSSQVWTHNTKNTRDLPHWIRLVYSTIQISDFRCSTVIWSTEISSLWWGWESYPLLFALEPQEGLVPPTASTAPRPRNMQKSSDHLSWKDRVSRLWNLRMIFRIFNDLKQHKEILERWPNWTRQV